MLLGLVAAILLVISEINSRKKKIEYDFEVISKNMFILKLAFTVVLLGAITYVLAGYNGLSWTAVIVLVVTLVYQFITTKLFSAGTFMPSAVTQKQLS